MKRIFSFITGLIVLIACCSTAMAVTQEEYDSVIRQRNALYQQLIDAGLTPCITIETEMPNTEATYIPSADETPADEFLYGSNGTEIRINSFVGTSTDIVIPQYIDGIPVTMIGDKAFAETKIQTVVIPEGVTTIGKSAFDSCKALTSVSIPSTLTYLPEECFSACSKLRNVTGLENINHFGNWCFQWCRQLHSTLFFNKDTVFEWGAFDRTGITGVMFLGGKISVAFDTFADSSLQYCYISEECDFSFAEYPYKTEFGTFHECESLHTLIIPASVTYIPETLLYGCTHATVYTPEGSAAQKYAQEQFLPVNTKDYNSKIAEFSSLIP